MKPYFEPSVAGIERIDNPSALSMAEQLLNGSVSICDKQELQEVITRMEGVLSRPDSFGRHAIASRLLAVYKKAKLTGTLFHTL